MVCLGLKIMAEYAIWNAEANAHRKIAHGEVWEKKLLNQVIFNIDGLFENVALVVMHSLRKDEQLDMFWDLPNDRKLCLFMYY